MKSKNEKIAFGSNKVPRQQAIDANKKQAPVNIDKSTATDSAKPRAGGGLANEGTNVSYDEQS
jgi:hypothetical protein